VSRGRDKTNQEAGKADWPWKKDLLDKNKKDGKRNSRLPVFDGYFRYSKAEASLPWIFDSR
jgi:hypothetical protein